MNLTLWYLGPSVGFINPWTGEEIPGIPGEHDDDDSMHGKSAICLKVVFVCVWPLAFLVCFCTVFIVHRDHWKCCRTGTRTFCLNRTGFGSGSNIKWNTKVNKKMKNESPTFWETMLLRTLKGNILYNFF
jgi:hypothetical protein